MKVLKILIWTIGIGIIGYLLFIFILVFSPYISNFVNREPFDSKEWIEWKDDIEAPSLRWHMVHNLTKKYELIGMSVEEIKELLGEPSIESEFYISYGLGMSGHGIDAGTLSLTIKDGIVIEYDIRHG